MTAHTKISNLGFKSWLANKLLQHDEGEKGPVDHHFYHKKWLRSGPPTLHGYILCLFLAQTCMLVSVGSSDCPDKKCLPWSKGFK